MQRYASRHALLGGLRGAARDRCSNYTRSIGLWSGPQPGTVPAGMPWTQGLPKRQAGCVLWGDTPKRGSTGLAKTFAALSL
jgi:hypothetical protein